MNLASLTNEQLFKELREVEPGTQDEQRICQEAEWRIEKSDQWILEAEQRARDNVRLRKEIEQIREERARALSWREVLSLWHTLYANPRIQFLQHIPRPTVSTRPTGPFSPKKLRHWTDFHHLHKSAFQKVFNQLERPGPGANAFESRSFYQTQARSFLARCGGNYEEGALVNYKSRTVEELVMDVWDQTGNGEIRFKAYEHHPLDDVVESQHDRVCYITPDQGARRGLFVIEYKVVDELSPGVVKEGFHDMEIGEIRQQIKSAKDEGDKWKETTEDAIAAIMTQAFDKMVNSGLSCGYAHGETAFIFLFTSSDSPRTLYYEKVILEQPFPTSSIDPDEELRLTAVGLVAAFTQMAAAVERGIADSSAGQAVDLAD